MNGANHEPPCHDVQLDVLLFGDEGTAEYQESAQHVELCSDCQDRLTEFAADEGDWDDVRRLLGRRASLDRPERSGTDHFSPGDVTAITRAVKLDFLSPPSHPEMLGRLGRYEIEQAIGSGGMGVVLKGFDTELNRPVAIKVMAPHLAHSGGARQRFAREARSAASIVHEHVVAIHDVKSDEAAPYLVMQYVAGQSLQQRVDQEGPLAPQEILRIGLQAAAGLAAAHDQGVIHRDVKPGNILLENGVERAMLTDFGLARAADDATLTHSGIIAGTPHYMSPEQARGGPADARSDLFSLGAVLYFMATGHPPFRAERAMAILHRICHDRHRPVQDINPAIPDDLAQGIDRLLQKKPGRRFASAVEVQQALARTLSCLQQRPSSRARWRTTFSRRSLRLMVGASAVAAVLAFGWQVGWLDRGAGGKNASSQSPSSRQTSGGVANQFIAEESEFASQLLATGSKLSQIENTPYPEFYDATHGLWQADLRAIEAEVTDLERHWLSGDSFNVPIGEVR